ncbi:unnamed protein product [Spodoptera littoralis]|uniref:Uncharacterized protein n=1 Tax=Spodoptera littoralis TaxID=7109 RepID=A0A9P0IAS8_SPOLI|nr:unnamed protein product [Spodoptera littoralis]CAH1642794.1 unnamed protein product [Spodoptera littoralis]
MKVLYFTILLAITSVPSRCQFKNRVGKFDEVFAWKQLTFDINGIEVLEDRFSEDDLAGRDRRSTDNIYFDDKDNEEQKVWDKRPSLSSQQPVYNNPIDTPSSAPINPNDEIGRFFVQYNNVPMGAERVDDRVFITIPRRRYGIPATLNYIDLNLHGNSRSPPLSPYPDMERSRSLISVYRTRADECGRLWMVDTGVIEIPNNPQYLRPPAIVVYDLKTDKQILRYQFKSSDIPTNRTATGLASITVVIKNGDCSDAYAYVPDLQTFGLIVYSLRENDSWRHQHNYFHFNPTSGSLRVAGHSFMWNDGIFSVAAGQPGPDGCRPVYFHPMVSHQEFSVSSCELEKRQANETAFEVVGDRGTDSQSTMHDMHGASKVMFFAEVGRDSISCWNTDMPLRPDNMAMLARDSSKLSYPSDLHVTDNEVWVTSNTLPRFIFSRFNPNDYNFFVYKANVDNILAGTVCEGAKSDSSLYHNYGGYYNKNKYA